ncbi:hypothetical protein RRF57_004902 [Xylaria bambusicola]|uniref:Uncharacterized protein n=1 Tax=Xylaria bambusicola TaxID=326684 RepID=A0AAN7UII7_9PEZI
MASDNIDIEPGEGGPAGPQDGELTSQVASQHPGQETGCEDGSAALVRPGGRPPQTAEEIIQAMDATQMGMFRVLEPSAVNVPHGSGHPLGMIYLRDPENSANIMSHRSNTTTYGPMDPTEARAQLVQMHNYIAPPTTR